MRKAMRQDRSSVDLYKRLDAVTMDERARLHAKAQLARAEYVTELIDRAASAFGRLTRTWIVQPIRGWFGKPIQGDESYEKP